MPYGQILTDLMTTSDGVSSAGLYGFKNRLINSDMRIDQRNAGASTSADANKYTIDRWAAGISVVNKFTVQQNAASVTPPVGFTNYLGVTSSSAYTVLTADFFNIQQPIEGLNVADLAWGTANAATVTLSFWVRSSLTGTFGGSLRNSAANRSYPFTYTINSANTWEKETITIAGDTSGTWLTTNGVGVYIGLGLGVGATYSGTAGAWAAGNFISATGATSVVGTNGATFYITGVQLEKGSTATSFDYRPYGTELALCQRYYYSIAKGNSVYLGYGSYLNTTQIQGLFSPKVSMRVAPTIEQATGTNYYATALGDAFNSFTGYFNNTEQTGWYNNTEASGVAGTAYSVYTNNASSSIALTAEL